MPSRKPLVQFLTVDQYYANQIQAILRRASSDIEKQILKAAGKPLNPVSQIQLFAQASAIKAHLNQDWGDIGAAIARGKLDAAALAGRITVELQSPILRKVLPAAEVEALAISEATRASIALETVLARLQASYIPLSTRVYRNWALSSGRVDALVNSALARGLTARELAAEVKAFVSPDVAGGMSYAAMRLGRTEINNAYHASTVDRYQQNRVVSEVDWNLSRSHPTPDVCNVYAQEVYPVDSVPVKPHPHCYCYITPRLMSEEDFLNNLLDGSSGGAPWATPQLNSAVRSLAPQLINLSVQASLALILKSMSNPVANPELVPQGVLLQR